MALGQRRHHDELPSAQRPGDLDRVADMDIAMWLRALSVDRDLATLARALRLRPRPEETRDVEKDVEANR